MYFSRSDIRMTYSGLGVNFNTHELESSNLSILLHLTITAFRESSENKT